MSESPKKAVAKAPKKKAAKAKSAHKGEYAKFVKEAILTVGKPVRGASRQAIKAYIAEKHSKSLGKGWEARLRTTLKRLATSGKLVQTKGSFRVSKEEKKAPKKPKKAKKAKKATKAKKTKKAKKPKTAKKTKKTTKRKSVKKTKSAKSTKKPRKAKASKDAAQ